MWLNDHKLNDVKPGDIIDALDTESIWCEALVDLKILRASGKSVLFFHYLDWSRKYDEIIPEVSLRLAPWRFYT